MMKQTIKPKNLFTVPIFALIASLLLVSTALPQEQIAIPLTSPGQPGELTLKMIHGSLQISGHDGDEVIVRFDNGVEKQPESEITQEGLRRISGTSPGFDVYEHNNRVEVQNISPVRENHFEIMVPRNFSLNLSMVHGDNFLVENVNGELDINHVNGDVELIDIGGSALVNTVNGNIRATFRDVTDGKPMAFSNVNGNIDITLPASAQLTAKMRSEWGDMFTDFDMNIQQGENIRSGASRSGGYQVSVNNWVLGEINGGGPEYLFKTLRGNIYIRSR